MMLVTAYLSLLTIAIFSRTSAVASNTTHSPHDYWQYDSSLGTEIGASSSRHTEEPSLDLTLALPEWSVTPRKANGFDQDMQAWQDYEEREDYQDRTEEPSQNENMSIEKGEGSGSSGVSKYPWNEAPAGADKVAIIRKYIEDRPRNLPLQRYQESDEQFAERSAKSWKIFHRKIQGELNHLYSLIRECNHDQDQIAMRYQQRLDEAKGKKKISDRARQTIITENLRRQRRGEAPLEINRRATNSISIEEKMRRAEAARITHLECQKKSNAKRRLRLAIESGVSSQVIAEKMSQYELDTLEDGRRLGSIKSALRRKLNLDPNNVELRMEAMRLGMNPDVRPTPHQKIKGMARWVQGEGPGSTS